MALSPSNPEEQASLRVGISAAKRLSKTETYLSWGWGGGGGVSVLGLKDKCLSKRLVGREADGAGWGVGCGAGRGR